MDSFLPKLQYLAVSQRGIASTEGDVETPRPDRPQMIAPRAVLYLLPDTWEALSERGDKVAQKPTRKRGGNADTHSAFLDPTSGSCMLKGCLDHL